LQVQRFLESPACGADSREGAGDVLAQQLAEWAADNGQVQALSQMPLPPTVEHALLGWLVRLPVVQLSAGTVLSSLNITEAAVAC
jgi:hypothetical protein